MLASPALGWVLSAALVAAPSLATPAPPTPAPTSASRVAAPTTASASTSSAAPVPSPATATPTTSQVPAPAPTATAARPGEELAARLLAEGHLVEAALEYESLWHTTRQPSALLGAAAAREGLGQRAHAAAYLRELVARGGPGPDLPVRIAALERGLSPVQLRVHGAMRVPQLIVRATPTSTRASATPPALRLRVDADPDGALVTLLLDAGTWDLTIDDTFYRSDTRAIAVATGPAQPVDLTITPRDEGATEKPWRPARLLAPGVLFAVGTGLLAGGVVEVRRNLRRDAADCPGNAAACRDLVTRGVSLRSAGAGLIGAGVGSLAASLVYLSPNPRVRRRVWASEAGIGFATVVASAVGVGLSARAYNHFDPAGHAWADPGYRDPLLRAGAQHTASAFFLGLGTTLLIRSIGFLTTHRWIERAARIKRSRRSGGPIARAPLFHRL